MPSLAEMPPSAMAKAALPGNSLYHLGASLIDQDGQAFKLLSRRGQPVLISMFYNSCQFVCPMLIDTMRQTENSLTPEERSRLSMLLVTFDPVRDDIKVLKAVAGKHQLDSAHWTLARTDAASVRKLAASLGIQYRLLSNGEFNHTTTVVLLDPEGRIAGRTNKIGVVDREFVKLVQKAIHSTQ
ncbi:MAG TPA: SCO family protein [Burkholderiaceae bacterium]|nr:SCO family protein [Burkholderiaceae bacterium]